MCGRMQPDNAILDADPTNKGSATDGGQPDSPSSAPVIASWPE